MATGQTIKTSKQKLVNYRGKQRKMTFRNTRKVKNTGKGTTEMERLIGHVSDPKQRAEIIKQHTQNQAEVKKAQIKAGTTRTLVGGAEAGTYGAATQLTQKANEENTVLKQNQSNLNQNVNGGISDATDHRDDDEGYDYPGILS